MVWVWFQSLYWCVSSRGFCTWLWKLTFHQRLLSLPAAALTLLPWEFIPSRECRGSTFLVTSTHRRDTILPIRQTALPAIPSSSQKRSPSSPSCVWIICGQKQSQTWGQVLVLGCEKFWVFIAGVGENKVKLLFQCVLSANGAALK